MKNIHLAQREKHIFIYGDIGKSNNSGAFVRDASFAAQRTKGQ